MFYPLAAYLPFTPLPLLKFLSLSQSAKRFSSLLCGPTGRACGSTCPKPGMPKQGGRAAGRPPLKKGSKKRIKIFKNKVS